MEAQLKELLTRLETVTKRLEAVEKQAASGPAPAAPSAASVEEYQGLIDQFIHPLVEASGKVDPVVKQQADLVLQAVQAQKAFLSVASQSKKPSDSVLQELIKPTSDLMGKISAIKDANRANKFYNNLAAVGDGIGALGWVVVTPAPAPYIGEMKGSADFYGNKILKDFKGKDQLQVDWITHFSNFLKELQVFVKKNHTTGVTWNPQGGDAKAAAPSPAAAAGGSPPPPPGPPPSVDFLNEPPANAAPKPAAAPATHALFSALNKGGDITAGLKKVADDQKTHKNPNLRAGSVVPAKETKEVAPPAAMKAAANKFTAGPAKVALEGNKWVVEYQVGNSNIVIDQTELKQTVYIYRCKNSTIQVKGKVNSVTLDDCEKVGVVFDNVLSGVETVNCKSLQIQALGKIPTITIDKTHGGIIYLSKDSLDVEIITSTSSELNVSIPQKNDDQTETPIPEQYKSFIKDGKLHTELVVHKA